MNTDLIKIGIDDRRQNGSIVKPSNMSTLKPRLAALRISPQSYLSEWSQVEAAKNAKLDYTSKAGGGAEMVFSPKIDGLPINKFGMNMQNLRKRKNIPGLNTYT